MGAGSWFVPLGRPAIPDHFLRSQTCLPFRPLDESVVALDRCLSSGCLVKPGAVEASNRSVGGLAQERRRCIGIASVKGALTTCFTMSAHFTQSSARAVAASSSSLRHRTNGLAS